MDTTSTSMDQIMDVNEHGNDGEHAGDTHKRPSLKITLLVINCILLSIGSCGVPLIMRLYFIHGGKRIWLSSWLLTAGWPLLLLVLILIFYYRRRATTGRDSTPKLFNMKPRLILASAVFGLLYGADNYLYAYGVARLPISTATLLVASQLAFTAGFAYLFVKQKFNSYSVNAVILLTVGSGVLALHTSGDRPEGESKRQYILGFIITLGSAALYGFLLPLIELIYRKAKQVIDYPLVMQIQVVSSLFATLLCTVGMLINNDFQAISREARNFDLGETKYYVILVCSSVLAQFYILGAAGVIFCASSLFSGIFLAVLIPVTEVLAVLFYHEKFQAEKGVALFLSLWGFVSYFYGEIKYSRKTENNIIRPAAEMELPHLLNQTDEVK